MANHGRTKKGKADGQGTITCPDGGTYVGEWQDDERHGQGTMTQPTAGRAWNTNVGGWKDGRRHGEGTLHIHDQGALYNENNSIRYQGEWKADEYHGQGTEFYSGDDSYVGGWEEVKRRGCARTFLSEPLTHSFSMKNQLDRRCYDSSIAPHSAVE